MSRIISLTLTENQHESLSDHLFKNNNESIALLTCGHRFGEQRTRLTVRSVHPVDDRHIISRSPTHIQWSTAAVAEILDEAEREGLCIIKVHSHPSGYDDFSTIDDRSDKALLPILRDAVDGAPAHGSAYMLPDGTIRARVYDRNTATVDFVAVVGDNLTYYPANAGEDEGDDKSAASHAIAFGSSAYRQFKRLCIGVVGASGTGSPLIEQIARLLAGTVMPVDPDRIEYRNLNRIYNSTAEHARQNALKVDVAREAIERMGLGTHVRAIPLGVYDPVAVLELAECDIIFGCVDSLEGRDILNLIATFYCIPYFDVGVRVDVGADGRIREVCGSVHYIKPGGSSLTSRGLFTIEAARAEAMRRLDPSNYGEQLESGYITGVVEHRPAVITLNSALASLATSELLARLNPFREYPNAHYAKVQVSLSSVEFIPEAEGDPDPRLAPYVGRGDMRPLLRRPGLG